MHEYELLANVLVGLLAGLTCGYVTQRLGLSPILGYLVAGVLVGPHTPGVVADARIAGQLAELGVVLLMFGVGLHFHLKDLLAVRAVAVPGALVQSAVATALGAVIALAFGWGLAAGVVLGIAVSVASTVVLTRVLVENQVLDTPEGHIAVGWLIVEDIFTVLVLVLLPAVAQASGAGGRSAADILGLLAIALLKVAGLAVIVLYVGSKFVPRILIHIARLRSRELFTLSVLVLALGVALGSAVVFGVSMALGAFLAGMVVGQSPVSQQAAADALPMRDAFAVLFFVSVGMLFAPAFLIESPLLVAAVLAVVLVAKPLAASLLVIALGYSVRTALTVAIGLAQIGEFSFILAQVAGKLGLLPAAGQTVLVACALLSISLNPLLFRAVGPTEQWLRRRAWLWALLNRRAERRMRLANVNARRELRAPDAAVHAIVVGHGPTGRTLARILRDFSIVPVIVDTNVDTVASLARSGQVALYGDGASPEILKSAGIDRARYVLVTLPDPAAATRVIATARTLNAGVKVFLRARYLAERERLERLGATAVCYEEAQAAVGLASLLLKEEGATEQEIRGEAEKIRVELGTAPSPIS